MVRFAFTSISVSFLYFIESMLSVALGCFLTLKKSSFFKCQTNISLYLPSVFIIVCMSILKEPPVIESFLEVIYPLSNLTLP